MVRVSPQLSVERHLQGCKDICIDKEGRLVRHLPVTDLVPSSVNDAYRAEITRVMPEGTSVCRPNRGWWTFTPRCLDPQAFYYGVYGVGPSQLAATAP